MFTYSTYRRGNLPEGKNLSTNFFNALSISKHFLTVALYDGRRLHIHAFQLCVGAKLGNFSI